MNIQEAFSIIKQEFTKIILSSLAIGFVAAAYSLTLDSVYRGTVVIASSKYNINLDNLSFGSLNTASLLGAAADPTHQDIKAIFDGNKIYKDFILEEDILKIIFKDDWDQENKVWRGGEKDFYDGIKVLKDSTDIDYSFDNGKTYLSFVWSDAKTAADWANKLAIRANQFITQNELKSIDATLQNLNKISNVNIQNTSLKNRLSSQVNDLVIKTTLKKAESSMGLTIFEEAIPPKKRIWPKRTLMVLLTMLVGGFASASILVIRRLN